MQNCTWLVFSLFETVLTMSMSIDAGFWGGGVTG